MEDHGVSSFAAPLEGLSALVIGGGGDGIGRAVTRAFAAAGASVAVADVVADRALAASLELTGNGAQAVPLIGNVRSMADLEGFVAQTVEAFGKIDALVTVVGGQVAFVPAVRLHEMVDEDWDLAYEMNLRWVARASRAVIRTFLAQGFGGSIVSVGSVAGVMAAPTQAAYGAAKAGVASLARTVAAEYARDGIRMNVVTCGAIATAVANAEPDPDGVPEIPMGRLGVPDDAASAVVYLSSPLASYITGQSLVVDGGVSVRGPFS
ncbi:3-oxoacyl-[acyl-carrier protein] reductase [Actinoplanes lutulentus]|uniref:3-oxoacyl-[acyl-carrier protein] reductase n=1 Tax=Actinoplanes lutulentus TaxID=1287878 RepID=A0A327Z5Q9_9ACTN|nr:3-oxoacyl-[acyl-carrier protein] reductase [Actinoplanes lutulentus]